MQSPLVFLLKTVIEGIEHKIKATLGSLHLSKMVRLLTALQVLKMNEP